MVEKCFLAPPRGPFFAIPQVNFPGSVKMGDFGGHFWALSIPEGKTNGLVESKIDHFGSLREVKLFRYQVSKRPKSAPEK